MLKIEIWSNARKVWVFHKYTSDQALADTIKRNWERDGYKVRITPHHPPTGPDFVNHRGE